LFLENNNRRITRKKYMNFMAFDLAKFACNLISANKQITASKLNVQFACNAHTICDPELRPLGTGLYPVISIINHR
jgi:hypothetical protein